MSSPDYVELALEHTRTRARELRLETQLKLMRARRVDIERRMVDLIDSHRDARKVRERGDWLPDQETS